MEVTYRATGTVVILRHLFNVSFIPVVSSLRVCDVLLTYIFGYEYPIVSVPLGLQISGCVCHHLKCRRTTPLTIPHVRGSGSSTPA